MQSRPSLTAEYMALFRALESSQPARQRLFSDPYAAAFLHQWRKWLPAVARRDQRIRLLPPGLRCPLAPAAVYRPDSRAISRLNGASALGIEDAQLLAPAAHSCSAVEIFSSTASL